MDDGPYPGYHNNGTLIKPLGVDVDVPMKNKQGNGRGMIIIIALSCFTVSVLFIGIAWICLLKCGYCVQEPEQFPDASVLSSSKPSGIILRQQNSFSFFTPVKL